MNKLKIYLFKKIGLVSIQDLRESEQKVKEEMNYLKENMNYLKEEMNYFKENMDKVHLEIEEMEKKYIYILERVDKNLKGLERGLLSIQLNSLIEDLKGYIISKK
ncbi:MAG: hypothetical protein ACRCZR_09665 [Cetobacterium sp.]